MPWHSMPWGPPNVRMVATASVVVGVLSAMMVMVLTTWEPYAKQDYPITTRVEPEPEVDPRFWGMIDRWRTEQQEQGKSRRLMHNAALGDTAPRHSSIHFFYEPSDGVTEGISAWYNEVQVTSRDEDSFYCVNGHAYGYAGIQSIDMEEVNGVRKMKKGKVLFSIWDQLCTGDDINDCPEDKRVEILECCEECTCERFGGEGTGAKSAWALNTWKMNTPYSFLTLAEAAPGNKVKFRGYFYEPIAGDWIILGTFLVNRATKDWAIKATYSFVEQWSKKNPEAIRWAKFGPVFARRGNFPTDLWDPVYQAKWFHGTVKTEDQTHINSNQSAAQWEMGIGGDIVKVAQIHDVLKLEAPQTSCPWQLIAFVGNESVGTLPTALPPVIIPKVNCGGSNADYSCGNCTQGNGAGWCNGECSWRASSGANAENGFCELTSGGRRLANPPQASSAICHGGGTGTTTPHPPGFAGTSRYVIELDMTVSNVNYAQLSADSALASLFLAAAKEVVVAKAGTGVLASHVSMTMSAGSVKLKATVTPPGSRNHTNVQYVLETAVASTLPTEMKTKLEAITGISAVTTGTLGVIDSKVSAQAVSMNILKDSKTFYFLINQACKPGTSWMLAILFYAVLLRLL